MPGRPPKLSKLLVVATTVLLVSGCAASVRGATGVTAPQPKTNFIMPLATALAPAPQVPFGLSNPELDGVQDRIQQATEQATERGATISVTVLDRSTGQLFSNDTATTMAIASVAKLFIADDVVWQGPLSADDRAELDTMLRSSDDDAAEDLWSRNGGDAIINRVASRYGLGATTPGFDGRWWNTISTSADLVHYYDMLLNGAGGLSAIQANVIIENLAQSTPTGMDGYPQRFGIPDGLFAEPVAVKQGWMCCIGADWMHLSTGVIGPDRRYVMAIGSLQAEDDATARATITEAVKTIFPGGRV